MLLPTNGRLWGGALRDDTKNGCQQTKEKLDAQFKKSQQHISIQVFHRLHLLGGQRYVKCQQKAVSKEK